MSALQLINPATITINTSVDASGALEFSYQSTALSQHENSMHIEDETLPITVAITDFDDATGHWTVSAQHEDENDVLQSWSRDSTAGRCTFLWSETNQIHEVEVSATNANAPTKKKLVFIKLRPHPDQPDCT